MPKVIFEMGGVSADGEIVGPDGKSARSTVLAARAVALLGPGDPRLPAASARLARIGGP